MRMFFLVLVSKMSFKFTNNESALTIIISIFSCSGVRRWFTKSVSPGLTSEAKKSPDFTTAAPSNAGIIAMALPPMSPASYNCALLFTGADFRARGVLITQNNFSGGLVALLEKGLWTEREPKVSLFQNNIPIIYLAL